MKRLHDWKIRLANFTDEMRMSPFEWGVNDCTVGLVAGAIKAITGEDLTIGMPEYKDKKSALKAIKELGFDTLEDLVASLLPEVHPIYARNGDVGVIKEGDEMPITALCVVDSDLLIAMGDIGHGRRPRSDMSRAFAVGWEPAPHQKPGVSK